MRYARSSDGKDQVSLKVKVSTWAKLSNMYTQLREHGIQVTRTELVDLLVEKYGDELMKQLMMEHKNYQGGGEWK